MEFIKDLKNIRERDKSQVGGKGFSLGLMSQSGIPIPRGFVILSVSFKKFLKETGLDLQIRSILKEINYNKIETIEIASSEIMSLVLQEKISVNLEKSIKKYFKKLDAKYVAVRSSATSEDSARATWAGQLDTFLNTTEDNLIENIKKCWASLFTTRAIFYRFENGFNNKEVLVSVVVQEMIQSEKSGVAFSVSPTTKNRDILTIDAGFGLGEAIVSGQISPDNYIVEKNNLIILEKEIKEQKRYLTISKTTGNKWKTVLLKAQKKQKLSDKEILILSKLIIKIEKYFKHPVDVEWAITKGKFFITQSRPITTIKTGNNKNESISDYIKDQKWFFRERTDTALLLNSTKRSNYVNYIKKDYGVAFADTMLVPIRKNKPVRVFNLWQAKIFHAISNQKVLRNSGILDFYIKKDNKVYDEIIKQGDKLILSIKEGNYKKSVSYFINIMNLYEISCAHFIIIFSLGLKLAENKEIIINYKKLTKDHDIWRNSVAFKEEKMNDYIFSFLQYLIKNKKIKITPPLITKYLTIEEVTDWINCRLSNSQINKIIISRKKNGFIYLNLDNKNLKIIDRQSEITKIRKYFLSLDIGKKEKGKCEIFGQIAFRVNKKTRGKVLIIKNKSQLKGKSGLIDGKILVAIQTTPHYIPYLKKSRAIITDEGGLTCHAAILAREFKIPCIVGTKIATRVLKNDNFVEIDFDAGKINIIR